MTSEYNNLIYDTTKNESKSMKYLLTNYISPITETKYVSGKIITTEYDQKINSTDNYTSNPISSTEYVNSTDNYTSNPISSTEYINSTNNYTSNPISSTEYVNSTNNYTSNPISSTEYINSTVNYTSNPISSTEYGKNINLTNNYTSNPISTTEYGKNINSTNNYTSKPILSYNYTINDKNAQTSLQKTQNKTTEYYTTDPLRMSYELNDIEEASATNKVEDIFTYKENNDKQIIYPTTYKNVNKYRSRSPGITRNNNYLLNYSDTTVNKTTNYSRSPGPSVKQKNNIYSSTPIRYIQYKYVTPTLVYPNNLSNIKYVPLNNDLVQTYYVTNNIPAYTSNNVRYFASNPVTPSNKNFLNTVTSGTYQTIPISYPLSSSSTNYYNSISNSKNNVKYISSFPKASTNVYGKNSSTLIANNLLAPTKSNSINNQINSPSNVNTFPTSNKSNQTNSFMPNSYGINSSPSSGGINYNSLSSKKGENNLGRNQYDEMESPRFNSETKNWPLNEISNFDKNKITHLCSEEKDNSSSCANFKNVVKKNLKNLDNSSHKSANEDGSSSGVPTILYSNGKKYLKKKLESKIDASDDNNEEINTNLNKLDNNNKSDKVSAFSYCNESSYSLDNNNQNYLYRPTQIKNYPSDYFSQYMFEHINQIRNNPRKFIQLIKDSISNIGYNKNGNLIYIGDLKVALCKGKMAFEEAIDSLSRTEPMNSLIFKSELCVEIPQKEKYFKSGDYLRKEIKEKVKNGIIIRAFWRDIIKDPKINFLLMIVDDNPIRRGDKRKDILDPKMKYIGINSGTMGKSFVCYTVLSNE